MIHKYVRTPHVRGSRLQKGDEDLNEISFDELRGKHLVIEEKIDGGNCGVSFDVDGTLLLQSRGHYLHGGPREKQFELLKQWASTHKDYLREVLTDRYVMYAENMLAKHTVFYDALPHYVMEFDVLDTKENVFLSTEARRDMLLHTNSAYSIVCPVLVLQEGEIDGFLQLKQLVKRSNFITDNRRENLRIAAQDAGVSFEDVVKHTDLDERMEGLYIKWEEDGIVKGRYKFVRESFTNSILDQETHWHDRPIVRNKLIDGAFERMFT